MDRRSPEITAWFLQRLPSDWFAETPAIRVDREEILVVGPLRVSGQGPSGPSEREAEGPSGPPERESGGEVVEHQRCIGIFRDETRNQRMAIAEEAEVVWGRKVSWGACCGELDEQFTTLSTPVMTRLRMDERNVLDTLIDAGVARSRSEALAWCVRLVGRHEADWIDRLRDAVAAMHEARASGPET